MPPQPEPSIKALVEKTVAEDDQVERPGARRAQNSLLDVGFRIMQRPQLVHRQPFEVVAQLVHVLMRRRAGADLVGQLPAHLIRRFTESVGTTPTRYQR